MNNIYFIQFKGLGEDFNFLCATTTNQSRIDVDVVDSCNVAGSHLWFCGYQGFGADVSARKEGRVTIFSYHDGRQTHVNVRISFLLFLMIISFLTNIEEQKFNSLNFCFFVHCDVFLFIVTYFFHLCYLFIRFVFQNIRVRERIVQICSVGSFVWVGTEGGHIQVFCALTYKPVAFGYLGVGRVILKILHLPLCGTVLVSLSDESIYAFHDNISKYNTTIPQSKVTDIFYKVDRTSVIRKLEEIQRYTSNFKTHCMTGVALHKKKSESDNNHEVKSDDSEEKQPSSESKQPTVEIWCGQDKGQITILNAKTLNVEQIFCVLKDHPPKEFNEALNVQFIETARSFESVTTSNNNNKSPPPVSLGHDFVWVVVYPGTQVSRWNVRERCVECSLDVKQHPPWHDRKFNLILLKFVNYVH